MKQNRVARFFQTDKVPKIAAITVGIVVVAAGIYVAASQAAIVASSAEPEGGTLSGNAKIVSDTSASNGKALEFSTPTTPPPPTTGGSCAEPMWPNPNCAGVPNGWTPKTTYTNTLSITTSGIVQDIRIDNANIEVRAPNVTLKNIEVRGGRIINDPGSAACSNGMVLENVSILPAPGQSAGKDFEAVVTTGGYTAKNVEIIGRSEGMRVGGGCGPVVIENTFMKIEPDAAWCRSVDWHGDGVQGYGGNELTVRNTVIELVEPGCGGTAPFFYPKNQGNTKATIERLMVKGGGYPFRLGTIGSVNQLMVVDKSWGYGPVNVDCSLLGSTWNASRVTIDANYQVTAVVGAQPCTGDGI